MSLTTLDRPTADTAEARIAAAKADAVRRTAAVTRFSHLRLEAEAILRQAGNLAGLPEVLRAQAFTAADIAGNRFHRVHGQANGDDAMALAADVDALSKAVEPLLAAIGAEAQDAFGAFEPKDFTGGVHDALSDVSGMIAAKGGDDDDDGPSIDPNAEHRTHGGRA